VLVCFGGTTNDMIGSTRSAVCSSTSVDASCGWGTDREGDGACCVWISRDGSIPHESVTLDEEEKAVLSSGVLVAT